MSGTSPKQQIFILVLNLFRKHVKIQCSRAVLWLGVRIKCQPLRLFQPKTSGIKRGLRSSGVEIESLIDVGEDMEAKR